MFFIEYAAFGISLLDSYQSSQAESQMAKHTFESANREMKMLLEHKKELEERYKIKRKHMTDIHGNKVETLSNKISSSLLEASEMRSDEISKSGFADPGSRKYTIEKDRKRKAGQLETKSLWDRYAAAQDELKFKEEEDLYQIDLQANRLMGEMQMAMAQGGWK